VFYKKFSILLVILFITLLFSSCQSVKPYQRVYLNDHFMQLGTRPVKSFGEKALVYREGSAGGGTGKNSGGCGCN
jgi:Domain of unknown function (DUF4266)